MNIITVPDNVLYNEDITAVWHGETLADTFILQIRTDDNKDFRTIYEGMGTSYTITAPIPYNKVKFRIITADGEVTAESKETIVIDYDIVNNNNDITIFPFGMRVNMAASKLDELPAIRETSQIITGVDGEIPIDRKYSSRVFDINAFMTNEFTVTERDNYISAMSAHINRAVRKMRYMRFRDKIYKIAVATKPNWDVRPQWCNLTSLPLKCYEVYGFSPIQNVLYGDGICVNNGQEKIYPIITLYGEYNNPKITVNGKEYQIAIDTEENDIVTIDCEKETVMLERNGELSYLAGAFYLEYPVFEVGENTVSGADKVEWREKYFTL